jgi:hypothetical protein
MGGREWKDCCANLEKKIHKALSQPIAGHDAARLLSQLHKKHKQEDHGSGFPGHKLKTNKSKKGWGQGSRGRVPA